MEAERKRQKNREMILAQRRKQQALESQRKEQLR